MTTWTKPANGVCCWWVFILEWMMIDRNMTIEETIAHVQSLKLRRRKRTHAGMRAELAKLIKSNRGLSDSLLAEAILAAGYRAMDSK